MTDRLTFLGAAGGVTGSATLVELSGARILIDCGVFQGEDASASKNSAAPVAEPSSLDAVVLTHGHLDHVGRLPLLARSGFSGPIYGHAATLAIASIVLRDAFKIAQFDGSGAWSENDLEETLSRFKPLQYRAAQTIAGRNASGATELMLFDAGHILGSASVLLRGPQKSVLASGDLGRRGTPILRDPNCRYPEDLRVDAVVIESTYGDREHPRGKSLTDQLAATLHRCLKDRGKVLIPAFSIGRTQELIYHLRAIAESRQLDDIPVVVDGPMGLDVTNVYERFRDCYDDEALALMRIGKAPLSFESLFGARGRAGSEAARAIDGPCIIIAGSGMCTGGRILAHLEEYLPDSRTDVLLVGYQAKGTLGRRLIDGADQVIIDGRAVRVRAHITQMAGFSAHADRHGLLNWLSHVPSPRSHLFVNHGEPKSAGAFAELARKHVKNAAVPELGSVAVI